MWDKRLATAEEIPCIACHTSRVGVTRIALGTRARVIQLFKLDLNGDIRCIFSVKMDSTVPSAIGFADYTNESYVFGLFNGCL